MIFALGAFSLVPLLRFRGQAKNASPTTLLNTPTTIVTLDLGTVVANDIILIQAYALCVKGGTGGRTYFEVSKDSGTGTFLCGEMVSGAVAEIDNQAAGSGIDRFFSAMFRVNAGGTLVLKLAGTSIGSNGTNGGDNNGLHVLVLKGS